MTEETTRKPSAVLYLYDDPTDELQYTVEWEFVDVSGNDKASSSHIALGAIIHAFQNGELDHIINTFADYAIATLTPDDVE
ncbi:hypothetical protein PHIN3_170 [Sinorhizobium phage phiN3]|uniref:Uncharacterized protein n=1 Tax=Sinorhizobium phage phiN3 TaxID=1647405 RepID=A0A0F6SJ19_9CAUD|nr:hypothetical protein AVT40_gp363 [Sinorhizobium phage phiN3]AKF13433.1 hypothetical protein PHIN3_170 [Sinorhizobium phage phiN3]